MITLAQAAHQSTRGERNRATAFAVLTLGSTALDVPANDVSESLDKVPTPALKWINVANEGDYKGHHQGEFSLTPEVLQQLVDNFHRSPKFKAGTVELDGRTVQAGVKNVVQYDYEHASEMAPWEGSIPTNGAPAIGWVRDLELRDGADGRKQLWALSWLGDQIREQIDNGQYDSVSIAWNPSGVHWQTGEPIGAVLTSIAFTNHPFLQDLESLAAAARSVLGSRGAAGQPRRVSVQRRASTAEAYAGSTTAPPSWEREPMPPEMQQLLNRLCSVYKLQPQADNPSIIRAAETAATSDGVLTQVLAALGVSDPQAAMATIPQLIAAQSQLQELMSQLQGLMTADASADQAVGEQDVAAAMSSRGWVRGGMVDPNLLGALRAQRDAVIASEIAKVPKNKAGAQNVGEVRAARDRGRLSFLQSYGVANNPATMHLMNTFASGPGAGGAHTQYQVPLSPFPLPGAVSPVQLAQPQYPQPMPQPLQLPQAGAQQPGAPDLSPSGPYPGRNLTERVMSFLGSVDPNYSKLGPEQRVSRASAWKRENPQLLPQQAA